MPSRGGSQGPIRLHMNWALGTPRVCFPLLLAVGATACAARTATLTSPGPSPFPSPSSPASIAPAPPPETAGVAPGALLTTALSFRGVPYRWGGENPEIGFDCSGFVKYVLGLHRLPAPRTAAEQFHLGRRVDVGEIRAGDLVFFSTIAPGASHVGLAVNSLEFVHAPAAQGVVRIDRIDSSYWRSRFVGARRILPPAHTSSGP